MRSDSNDFASKNRQLYKEPLYYVEVMFDDAYTDPYYFTSSEHAVLPSTATSSNTFHNTLKIHSGTQQKINPIQAVSSIGGSTVELVDVDGVISDLLATKWAAEESLTNKRFRFYVGYRGLANSDYVVVTTQLKSDHEHTGTSYIFKLEDLQRTTKKNIFELNQTTLSQSVTIDQIAIPVSSTTAFELNWHDANYTHLASQSVGYISIKVNDTKEVISYLNKVSTAVTVVGTDVSFAVGDSSINSVSTDFSGFTAGQFLNVSGSGSNDANYIISSVATHKLVVTDINGTAVTLVTEAAGATITVGAPVQFYNCTRAVLNTRAMAYDVDTTITADRRQKVDEHVYIETTVPKIIYGIYTGVWLGTANTLPSNWNLGIDTSLINSASFTNVNDTRIFRFSGEKKQDAKKFIAEQLCLPLALYTRVLNDGDIALRRATGVLSDAAYVRHITTDDIVSFGNLVYRDKELYNRYSVAWNYEDEKDTTTRLNILEDSASQAKFGRSESTLSLEFRGLHGSATTLQDIYNVFNMLRDRHAGPPIRWNVRLLYSHNDLEIGDIIRVTVPEVYDATNRVVTYVDRSFEVQGINVDWITGEVDVDLFASTEKAGELSSTSAATVLSSTFYTQGAALNSVLTMSGNNVTASGTLTASEYYWGGDLTINSDVTVTTTQETTYLYVKGFVTLNGSISTKGKGDTNGDGTIGVTKSGGSVYVYSWIPSFTYKPGTISAAELHSIPYYDLKPDSAGDTLTGLPTNLEGMAGPAGVDITLASNYSISGSATGGAGGNGGGGLVIVCRGISAGANGSIITSGNDGTSGTVSTLASTSTSLSGYTVKSGSGGGGAPGGVLIIIDGNDYSCSLSNANFVQDQGDSKNDLSNTASERYGGFQYYDAGYQASSRNTSMWRVQYVPDTTAAVEDVPSRADVGTALSPTETQNSPSTVAQNLSTVQIDVTPPSDTNYSYSNIYYKLTTQDEYVYVGPALNSVTLPPTAMDGSTYDVIAKPVSKTGVESSEYVHTTVTVSNAKGGANMATGNFISIGQTAYDTGQGAWIEKTGSGVKASFGNSSGNKVLINNDDAAIVTIIGSVTADEGTIGGWTIGTTDLVSGSGANTVGLDSGGSNPAIYAGSATPASAPFRVTQAGAVTASNATITGTITTSTLTADGGTIGGWDIDSTTLQSANNRVILDSANQRIRVQSAAGTSYVNIDASGVTGVDSVLGTTFTLPTDGSAPTFASGVINSTVFNITSAGILETASTVGDGTASSAGIRINDTGIKGYPANSSTPNFTLSTTDGKITAIGGTIGGWTISSTSLANSTNIILDSSSKYFAINSATYGNAGIQLQYNGGTPRAYIGDGSNNYLKYDGTNIIVGRETQILGADAYNNDTVYISGNSGNFLNLDGSSGTGSITSTLSYTNFSVAGGAGTAFARWYITYDLGFKELTWDNTRRWKAKIKTASSASNEFMCGTGGATNSSDVYETEAFVFKTDGYIYSRTCNGTNCTETQLQTYSTSTSYELEIYHNWDVGSTVYYVDGVAKRDEDTYIPTGTTNAEYWMFGSYVWASGTMSYKIGDFKFEQQ